MSFSKIFGGVKIIPVATFNDPEQAVRIARIQHTVLGRFNG